MKSPLRTLQKAHKSLNEAQKLLSIQATIFNMASNPEGGLIRKTMMDIVHDKIVVDGKVNDLIMKFFNK